MAHGGFLPFPERCAAIDGPHCHATFHTAWPCTPLHIVASLARRSPASLAIVLAIQLVPGGRRLSRVLEKETDTIEDNRNSENTITSVL